MAIFVIIFNSIEFSRAYCRSSSQSLIAQTAAVMRVLALPATLWLVSPAQAAEITAYQPVVGPPIINIAGATVRLLLALEAESSARSIPRCC